MVLSPKVTYSGLSGAFHTIIKHESPRALFRGISLVAMGAGPAHALYFSAYEVSKKRLSMKYNSIVAQGKRVCLSCVCVCVCVCLVDAVPFAASTNKQMLTKCHFSSEWCADGVCVKTNVELVICIGAYKCVLVARWGVGWLLGK